MKKLNVLMVALLVAGSALAQTPWTLDKAHTKVGFTVTHMTLYEVDGLFKDFTLGVTSPADNFDGASIELVAQVASIDTENENRDKDLKSDNYFSAEKFPQISFKGKLAKVEGKYKLNGDLTIRDVTKPIVLDVAYNGTIKTPNGERAGFKVTGTLDRFEYGIKSNRTIETGGLVISKDVVLSANVSLTRKLTP